jgi:symplekin
MDATVQEHINKLITMLIRSMGAKHPKILDLVRRAPAGAEPLVLRVITILSEKGKVSPALVEVIKEMMATKEELDPRYLVAILPELDRATIVKHLPRIVSMLSGQEQDRTLVSNVFENIMAPPVTFGINAQKGKGADLLSPVELLIELHNLVPNKKAIDGGFASAPCAYLMLL